MYMDRVRRGAHSSMSLRRVWILFIELNLLVFLLYHYMPNLLNMVPGLEYVMTLPGWRTFALLILFYPVLMDMLNSTSGCLPLTALMNYLRWLLMRTMVNIKMANPDDFEMVQTVATTTGLDAAFMGHPAREWPHRNA